MKQAISVESQSSAVAIVREQLARAIAASKCHGCGCLLHAIEVFENTAPATAELTAVLGNARRVLVPKKYDCLGCDVCFPAVAANAFADVFPDAVQRGESCPTNTPDERAGWPPLPGDYSVVRYGGSVAVCTLNSDGLVQDLTEAAPEGLAIVGTMKTENLGIERVARNVLANPNIRFLVLCGEDTRRLVGHLPGQCMESLFANGIDDKQGIVGAKGKRPFLKNLAPEHIEVFRRQVQLVSMIGDIDVARIAGAIAECHAQRLPAFGQAATDIGVAIVRAKDPQFFKADSAGFLVVYPERREKALVVEHYTNAGLLDCVVQGLTPAAVYCEVVKRGLVSQLDHAAYLGRELAIAEGCLRTGAPYVQDRVPGDPMPDPQSV